MKAIEKKMAFLKRIVPSNPLSSPVALKNYSGIIYQSAIPYYQLQLFRLKKT